MLPPDRTTRATARRRSTRNPQAARKRPAVGDVVEVLWEDRNIYFRGTLSRGYVSQPFRFRVSYDDGDWETVSLDDQYWRHASSRHSPVPGDENVFEPGDLETLWGDGAYASVGELSSAALSRRAVGDSPRQRTANVGKVALSSPSGEVEKATVTSFSTSLISSMSGDKPWLRGPVEMLPVKLRFKRLAAENCLTTCHSDKEYGQGPIKDMERAQEDVSTSSFISTDGNGRTPTLNFQGVTRTGIGPVAQVLPYVGIGPQKAHCPAIRKCGSFLAIPGTETREGEMKQPKQADHLVNPAGASGRTTSKTPAHAGSATPVEFQQVLRTETSDKRVRRSASRHSSTATPFPTGACKFAARPDDCGKISKGSANTPTGLSKAKKRAGRKRT